LPLEPSMMVMVLLPGGGAAAGMTTFVDGAWSDGGPSWREWSSPTPAGFPSLTAQGHPTAAGQHPHLPRTEYVCVPMSDPQRREHEPGPRGPLSASGAQLSAPGPSPMEDPQNGPPTRR